MDSPNAEQGLYKSILRPYHRRGFVPRLSLCLQNGSHLPLATWRVAPCRTIPRRRFGFIGRVRYFCLAIVDRSELLGCALPEDENVICKPVVRDMSIWK
jgi:hypothetical protein